MKIPPVLFTFLMLLVGCASQSGSSYREITRQEAAEIMALQKSCILLDAGTKKEYERCHIPGAIHLPDEEIGENIVSLLRDKDQMILIYSRSGKRSRQAAETLSRLGCTNVLEFVGITT